MNERIFNELYKKAWGHFPCPTGEPELEKFAELILTEVISTIYRSDISDKKQEKLVDELAYKFGMK